MALQLVINGKERNFEELETGAGLPALVQSLGFRSDRVAVERNGEIVPRSSWRQTTLTEGDRLEVVHFVGGGSATAGA